MAKRATALAASQNRADRDRIAAPSHPQASLAGLWVGPQIGAVPSQRSAVSAAAGECSSSAECPPARRRMADGWQMKVHIQRYLQVCTTMRAIVTATRANSYATLSISPRFCCRCDSYRPASSVSPVRGSQSHLNRGSARQRVGGRRQRLPSPRVSMTRWAMSTSRVLLSCDSFRSISNARMSSTS
jgi:hypothetical protein